MKRGGKRVIYTQKVWFYTYVLATTANLPEFRRRRRMDDVLATLRMSRSFARENFTSSRRRHLISSSILKVTTNSYTMLCTQAWNTLFAIE